MSISKGQNKGKNSPKTTPKAPAKKTKSRARVKETSGRPEINLIKSNETEEQFWKKVDTWLMKGVNGTTIASRLGCHADTFYSFGIKKGRWGAGTEFSDFSAYKADKVVIGDDTLRERQYDVAVGLFGTKKSVSPDGTRTEETIILSKPNTTMLMWLGKQRLGQSDSVDLTSKGEKLENGSPTIIKRVVNIRADKRNPKSE